MDSQPGSHLLLAFEGFALPDAVRDQVAAGIGAGMTVFRAANVDGCAQLRELTDDLRRAAGRPLLVCADQEGGQFLALGEATTPFAGNLALGAADDPDLTERVARAIGAEVRAVGVDVDYAPDCDLLTDLGNPSVGIRSFGDDPARVAPHAAAFVRGLRAAGAAACPKHFPGKGAASVDSHHGLPVIAHSADRLRDADLAPFRAAIAAGAEAVMSSHAAYPALTGRDDLPGTVAEAVLTGLLRRDLGFGGVAITDALDMGALAQGAGLLVEAVAALRAGADLLLATTAQGGPERLVEGLAVARSRGLLDGARLAASSGRVRALAERLQATPRPDLDVVGCAAHRALADELAARALTLVRDPGGLLPLAAGADVLAVMPRPFDRTPADTSATVGVHLAPALRGRGLRVREHVTSADPRAGEIADVLRLAAGAAAAVVGTVDAFAHRGQVALAAALVDAGVRVMTVSLRTPDGHALAAATTHACTYGLHRPSLDALAAALVGGAGFPGRLPVRLPAHTSRPVSRSASASERRHGSGESTGLVVAGGRVVAGGAVRQRDLHVDAGRVVEGPAAGARVLYAGGGTVLPGLVDLQVNGAFGVDLASAPERLWEVAALLPATGVTAFLPTLFSCPPETVDRGLAVLAAGPPRGWRGATPLGWHLEGPFLDPAHRGIHPEPMVRPPDVALARRWAATGQVRMVTLAPEMPGALAVAAVLAEHGIVVAAGHSGATYEQGLRALDAGVRCATHLWNAMPPMAHRAPGLAGAVLDDPRAVVCLIPDGVHVHPAAVRLARAAAGPGRLALVTDATAAAGLPPGRARLGDVGVVVGGDAPRDDDGNLAGSDLTMDEALRRYRHMTGAGWPELAEAAAGIPARLLADAGRGHLAPGARADAVIMGAGGEVCATLVGGEVCHPAGEPDGSGEEGRRR